jgi:transposase InsO family protein
VGRHAIQESLRGTFTRWGLPRRLRVDNGYPWGSTGAFPPELALWLLGLGVELVWIPPGCPQDNGVVERAQGVGRRRAEPHDCGDAAELQRRCDALDRLQREAYPYAGGHSRWATYPQLRHSGRRYSPAWEARHWSLGPVLRAVAGVVVVRRVDRQGCVSLYNRTRYVGKQHAGGTVYVSLDASGPAWVFAAADGTQLRSVAADELTARRIRELSVGARKGRDKRV